MFRRTARPIVPAARTRRVPLSVRRARRAHRADVACASVLYAVSFALLAAYFLAGPCMIFNRCI